MAANIETKQAFDLHALNISARANTTRTQDRAIDLHKRGFNVFPLPYGSKEPFKGTPLKRLYNSRLHLCGDGVEPCQHGTGQNKRTGKRGAGVPTFASLFIGQKNFAVMCGKTSGNLLAVDCDSQTAYDAIGKELDALALPYWAFTSHRGGCYLLRVIEGEAANVTKAGGKFADVELWGNSHYCVVPMSVHPSGTVYRWRGDTEPRFYYANEYDTLPAVSVTALGWLGVTLQAEDKPQRKPLELFGLSAEYAALSEANRKTLASGANEGERNTRLTALAYDMAANFDRAEIEADFLQAAAKCEPSYSKRDALAILKSAYRKERTPAKGANAGAVVDVRIQRLYAFVNSYDWKAKFGRKARTRRAVFVACVDRSAIEGETFRASIRELAESVNRAFQYVGVCLRDLQAAGLLRRVTSWADSASGANVYGFGDTVKHYCEKKTVITTCNNNVLFSQYSKNTNSDAWRDAFGLKGLGAVAGEVFKALQAKQYKSVYAIAKDTGAAYNSVKEAVKRLVTHRLAIHSEAEGLYYADTVTEAELFNLSVTLQTNGRAELQRIRHKIDREIFLNRNMAHVIAAHGGNKQTKPSVTRKETPSMSEPTPKKSPKNEFEWHEWDGLTKDGIYLEFRKAHGRTECREITAEEHKRRIEAKTESERRRAFELVSKIAPNKAAEISSRDKPLDAAKSFLVWASERGNKNASSLLAEFEDKTGRCSADEILI